MIDKKILNIVQNNPEIFADTEVIQFIFSKGLEGTSASKAEFKEYFNKVYTEILLEYDDIKERLYNRLYSKLDSNNQLSINDMDNIILESKKRGIFDKIFDLNFVVLNDAQGIITNILEKNEYYLRGLIQDLYEGIMYKWDLFSKKEYINYINSHKSDVISYIQERLEDTYIESIFSYGVTKNSRPLSLLERIDNNEIRKLAKFLLSVIYNKVKKAQIDEEHREKREKNIKKEIFSLDKLNLEIDESIVLDAVMFHNMTLDKSIPIIYVNGNVIANFTTPVNGNERVHHSVLFKQYCEDMSLHKNDQIKKTKEEWENLTKNLEPDDMEIYQLMNDYKCVRAVQPTNGKAVAIIVSFNNAKEAAKAFQAQLPNCGNVFAFDESMTFLERKARLNRLMKKVK